MESGIPKAADLKSAAFYVGTLKERADEAEAKARDGYAQSHGESP
jgi:hypothetical protein